MIRHMTGSIFDSGAQALVCPVNCAGVAGKGLAKEFKRRWPLWFSAYRKACMERRIRLGRVDAWPMLDDRVWAIVNFPTKDHWRERSNIADVTEGLEILAAGLDHKRYMKWIKSIAVPALGCGLGGLPWPPVLAAIERTLGQVPGLEVMVYPPGEA